MSVIELIIKRYEGAKPREMTVEYILSLLEKPQTMAVLAKYEELSKTSKMVIEHLCLQLHYRVGLTDLVVMTSIFEGSLKSKLARECRRQLAQPVLVSLVREFEHQVREYTLTQAKKDVALAQVQRIKRTIGKIVMKPEIRAMTIRPRYGRRVHPNQLSFVQMAG